MFSKKFFIRSIILCSLMLFDEQVQTRELTEDELREVFYDFADSDEKITAQGLRFVMDKWKINQGETVAHAQEMINRVDTSGTGKIGLSNFLEVMAGTTTNLSNAEGDDGGEGSQSSDIRTAFHRFSKGRKKLTAKGLKDALKEMANMKISGSPWVIQSIHTIQC